MESCVQGYHNILKMFGPHPLEKYCNALAKLKTPTIATLSPLYTVVGHTPRKIAAASCPVLSKERNYLL